MLVRSLSHHHHLDLMLCLLVYRFGSFLFGGFLIPLRDLYYPFELFYHIFPFSYYARSAVYELLSSTTFEPCQNEPIAVFVDSSDGTDVLEAASRVMPLLTSEDQTGIDLLVLVAIGLVYKLVYVAGVVYKSRQASHFQPGNP